MYKAVKVSKKSAKESEKAKLERFNKEMGTKINTLQFSKTIKADTNDIDADFAALAENDSMKQSYIVSLDKVYILYII